MVFASYSHRDEKWRRRFERLSKPLSRVEKIEFWSDERLSAGTWETQIQNAMNDAEVALLLVSDSFLESDYIMQVEFPYFLKAYKERGLMIVWAYLSPCDLKRSKEITQFQAMGDLTPMSSKTESEWKKTMLKGCDMISEFLECPVINSELNKRSFPRVAEDVQLLIKPARRNVEVLVFAPNGKWYRQRGLSKGETKTRFHLGDIGTKAGTAFKIVAITSDSPLSEQSYSNLPRYRTKSEEIVIFRKND
jgi:hypothetical protein